MEKNKYRSIESFEDSLRHCVNAYTEGECDLETVISAANKLMCFKANSGYRVKRIEHNEREKAFHDQWLEENAPIAGINNGNGILQDLFIEGGSVSPFNRKVIEEINNRDRLIVATVIQWLGSNCGMCFLGEALERFGARIIYNKK